MDKEQAKLVAQQFTEGEKMFLLLSKATPAVIKHKGGSMLGSVSHIIDSDQEIVLCAHTSVSVDEDLIEAVLEISPREVLTIDDELELAPRQDVLRLVGTRMMKMTPEQTEIAAEAIKTRGIVEIS